MDAKGKMDKDFNAIPLAESNLSLKLVDIQNRCSQLLQGSGDALDLTLEEPLPQAEDSNPYNNCGFRAL